MAGPSDPVRIVEILPGISVVISGGVVAIDQTTPGTTNRVVAGNSPTTLVQTPTITAGAYAARDAVGGLLTFANAARIAGGGGWVDTLAVIDDGLQSAALELWLFNQTFTAMADNAPWNPSDADMQNYIGTIDIAAGDYFMGAANCGATLRHVGFRFNLVGTSLFGQLVTPDTPTYTATDDVTIKAAISQD